VSWDGVCVNEAKSLCGGTCSGTTSCAHPECVTGTALTAACSSCAATVCASDAYCCSTSWDGACVTEAKSWCGLACP
jgi:hypothetical protein